MSNDISDIEWKCFCGHINPDFDERCNGCGQERYPDPAHRCCVCQVAYVDSDSGYDTCGSCLRNV